MMPGKAVRKTQIDDRFKEMFYSDKFKVGGAPREKGAARKEKNKELADYYYTKDEVKEKEDEKISHSEDSEAKSPEVLRSIVE
jgi:hypothetical protein